MQPTDWKLAVVFRRENDQLQYVGTVSKPALPSQAGDSAPRRSPKGRPATDDPTVDYEIWAVGDGATRGVGYSSARRTWGELFEEGTLAREHKDDGTVQRLLRRAQPAVAQAPQRPDAHSEVSGPLIPPSLEHLCSQSNLIAVGRVVGILRSGYTPMTFPNVDQHTVYVFAVEQYVKSEYFGMRPLLKVWQSGGRLPWTSLNGRWRGVGYESHDDPMLIVGERYVLFLRGSLDPRDRRRGYVESGLAGVHGKAAELDEFGVVYPWGGKLLLRNGFTRAPKTSGSSLDHWRFKDNPQILDVPEATALQAIREVVARQRGR